MLTQTDTIIALEREWQSVDDAAISQARERFTVRPLNGVNPLIGSLKERDIYRTHANDVNAAVQTARRHREEFSGVLTALSDMLDLERREEQDRQARSQRTLSLAVAALTIVMAFPIVIGQLGWGDIKTASEFWPSIVDWNSYLLDSMHADAVLGVIVFVLLISGFLAMYMLLTMWPFGRRGWTYIPSKIAEVWLLAEGAGETWPEKPADTIDALDKNACDVLVDVLDRILKMRRRDEGRQPSSRGDINAIRRQVELIISVIELFGSRPAPLWLPRALCLLRYQSERLVSESVVSDDEFQRVLTVFGFDHKEIAIIKEVGKQLCDVTPADFVSKMVTLGVSARHKTKIEPDAAAALTLPPPS